MRRESTIYKDLIDSMGCMYVAVNAPELCGPRTAALLARVRGHATGGVLVMVTHQVNITAATGQVPAMGEAFAVRAGPKDTLRIVGRYPFA